MKPIEPMKAPERWWPEELGEQPNAAGGQNEMRYAFLVISSSLKHEHYRTLSVSFSNVLVAGILTGQFRLMAEIEGTVIFWMAPKINVYVVGCCFVNATC
jgi:hypothetical protein